MEFQVNQNQLGYRSLYFGHPFSKETYTNSLQLKTPFTEWEVDLDGIYSGKKLWLNSPESTSITRDPETIKTELRIVRGTKALFIGDYIKVQEMESDMQVYYDLCRKATVKSANPNYLDFDVYTKRILKDPLKNVFELKSIDPEMAKKYMDYAVLYDKDEKYSNKLISKSYFTSCDAGVFILSDDFVDFNFELTISVDFGVLEATIWMSENTSKYTDQYKEI